MNLLSKNQMIFADEYVIDRNGARAYKVAFRSCKKDETARANASRLLTKANIVAYIEKRLEKISGNAEVTAERVLKEDGSIAFSDLRRLYDENGELIPVHHLPKDIAAAISGIEIKERILVCQNEEKILERAYRFRFWDKGAALGRLERHLGMYAPKEVRANMVEVRIPVKSAM